MESPPSVYHRAICPLSVNKASGAHRVCQVHQAKCRGEVWKCPESRRCPEEGLESGGLLVPATNREKMSVARAT